MRLKRRNSALYQFSLLFRDLPRSSNGCEQSADNRSARIEREHRVKWQRSIYRRDKAYTRYCSSISLLDFWTPQIRADVVFATTTSGYRSPLSLHFHAIAAEFRRGRGSKVRNGEKRTATISASGTKNRKLVERFFRYQFRTETTSWYIYSIFRWRTCYRCGQSERDRNAEFEMHNTI